MFGFYCDVRCSGVDMDRDGDTLLFQWGTYDWGDGEHFEIDITRQLIRPESEDEDIWQLHLTYQYPPAAELRALGKGHRWCHGLEEVRAFEGFVRNHGALAAGAGRNDARVELSFECAG